MSIKEFITRKFKNKDSDFDLLMKRLNDEYESQNEKDKVKTGSYRERIMCINGLPYLNYDYISEVCMEEVKECFENYPEGVIVFIHSSNEIYLYTGENDELIKLGTIDSIDPNDK